MKNFAKRISALVLAVVVSAAVLCPAAFAAQLPSLPKDECVVDDANALNSQVTQTIEELNAKLETNCKGAQIGVLTVQYTGNLSTEDYATEAFNACGIGNATNNNGVLILLVMESAQYADGDYYLTYGDGFRNTTLAKQASAIAQTMESDFANRDYSDAVITCANNVADTIASVYGVNLDNGSYENGSTVQPGYQGGQSSGGSTLTDILTLVVGAVLLIVIIRSMAYVFASPCGWLWCFGGPRPPYRRRGRRGPPPPPPGGYYGGSRGPRPPRGGFGGMGGGFGGMGGGSFGGGAGRGGFGGGSFGGGFGGMGGGSSHGGGGGRGR